MRRILQVAGLGPSLVAACTLTTDLDGLSGGDGTIVDGGLDAGAEADSGSDAPDGPVIGFCDAHRSAGFLYCRDFDDGEAADSGWDYTTVTPGGEIVLDSESRTSPPASLHAILPTGIDTCSYARAVKTVGDAVSHGRVGFSVNLGEPDSDDSQETAYFVVSTGACSLILGSSSTGGLVNEQRAVDGGFVDGLHPLDRVPAPGVWTRVEVEFDRTSGALDVTLDGESAFDRPQTMDPACGRPTAVTITPGLHCQVTPTAPKGVHIDDLIVHDLR